MPSISHHPPPFFLDHPNPTPPIPNANLFFFHFCSPIFLHILIIFRFIFLFLSSRLLRNLFKFMKGFITNDVSKSSIGSKLHHQEAHLLILSFDGIKKWKKHQSVSWWCKHEPTNDWISRNFELTYLSLLSREIFVKFFFFILLK